MKQKIVKIVKNYKLAFVALLIALVGLQSAGGSAFAVTQIAALQKTELQSSAAAKRAMVGMQPRKFAKIKDARMRNAIQQSYKALSAIAGNNSKEREVVLMADFDRTIKDLKALPQPTAGGIQECDDSYTRCMELCKETGGDCKLCGLGQNGCYLNKLAAEATKNPLDPTP